MAFLGSNKTSKSTITYTTDNSQDNSNHDSRVAAGAGANVFTTGGGNYQQTNSGGNLSAGGALTINNTADRAFDTVDRAVSGAIFNAQRGLDNAQAQAETNGQTISEIANANNLGLHNLADSIGKYIPYLVVGAVVLAALVYYKKGK